MTRAHFIRLLVILAIVAADGSLPVCAAECDDDGRPSQLTSIVDLPVEVIAYAAFGELAVVGTPRDGLAVLDLSDPAAPKILGRCPGVLARGHIAVAGNRVFLPGISRGVGIIDVYRPESPVLVGQIASATDARSIVVADDVAFVASNSSVQVWNVADPVHPEWFTTLWDLQQPLGLAVSDHYLYVTDQRSGLTIFDVGDPANPSVAGRISGFTAMPFVALADTLALVLASDGNGRGTCRILSIDISDPHHPELAGALAVPGAQAEDLFWQGGLAHVLMSCDGLVTIDTSDPEHLTIHGRQSIEPMGFVGSSAERIVVLNRWRLAAVTIGEPIRELEPEAVWRMSRSHPSIVKLFVTGSAGFLFENPGGLQILDLSDPRDPQTLGRLEDIEMPDRLLVHGDRAYATTKRNDSYGLDIADLAAPRLIADPGCTSRPVAADGRCLFAIRSGVEVFYVSEADFAVRVGDYGRGTDISAVAARDGLFFAAAADGVFHVGSFADPSLPQQVGTVSGLPGRVDHLELAGPFAFALVSSPACLQIVDISDPRCPRLRGRLFLPHYVVGVTVSGTSLYCRDYDGALYLVDVQDPDKPAFVASFALPHRVTDLVVLGDRLVVVDGPAVAYSVYPLPCR